MQYIQISENDLLKRRVYLHLVDATDGITAKTGQTGTCKISINGAAPSTSINSITEIDSTNLPGDYYLQLDTTEISKTGIVMVRFKNANVAEFVQIVQVMAFDPYTQFGALNGGGADVDYKRIAKLIQQAVDGIPKTELPEPESVDLKPLQAQVSRLQATLQGLDIPQPKELDLGPMLTALEAVRMQLPKEADLNPVLAAIQDLAAQKITETDDMRALLERMRKFFGDDIDSINEKLTALNTKFDDLPFVVIDKRKEPINSDQLP